MVPNALRFNRIMIESHARSQINVFITQLPGYTTGWRTIGKINIQIIFSYACVNGI